MGIFDNLSNLLQQASTGNASEPEVHAAYDQVSQAVPQGVLADGLTHAFQSDQTPPFEQMLTELFSRSTPDQKAGILNRLMAAAGPAGLAQLRNVLGGAAGVGAAGTGAGATVSPQQAQQVPPATVQTVAQEAARKDPTIMQQAASFYSQHPTLVKSLGVGALALIMSHMNQSRKF
jgi:hypothetical protein